jgi:hypothetical protein
MKEESQWGQGPNCKVCRHCKGKIKQGYVFLQEEKKGGRGGTLEE